MLCDVSRKVHFSITVCVHMFSLPILDANKCYVKRDLKHRSSALCKLGISIPIYDI